MLTVVDENVITYTWKYQSLWTTGWDDWPWL